MKKLVVNDNCMGCGMCISLDPEHFDYNEEGYSTAISQENLDSEQLQPLLNGGCPVSAIHIEEDNSEEE